MADITTYCTQAEMEARLGIDNPSAIQSAQVTAAIKAASRFIDNYCNEKFWIDSVVRAHTFEPQSLYRFSWRGLDDGIATQTGLIVQTDSGGDGTYETTWTTNDYELLPYNAPYAGAEARPWTSMRAVGSQTFPLLIATALTRRDRIKITAKWGWPAVPDAVAEASRILAARIFRRKDSPEGIGGVADLGVIRITGEDRDVAMLLGSYRKFAALVA